MNRMIISNLAYRPLRSIISVFAVAIEVTMILLIVGLVLGILEDSKDRQKGIGADVMVRPSGAGVFSAQKSFALTGDADLEAVLIQRPLTSQFESASNDQHSTRSRSMECLPVPGQS